MARYPDAQWCPSPNFGYPAGIHGRNGETVRFFEEHITDSDVDKEAHRAWFLKPDNVAPQFCVFKDGSIDQYVDTDDAAWHTNPLLRPDPKLPYWGQNPNLVSIGVEHQGRPGVPLTEPQILATIRLHRWLNVVHPLFKLDRTHIVGHYQINSVDKANDPGPAFPWDRLMEALMSNGIKDLPTAIWNTEEAVRQLEAIKNGGQTEGLESVIRRLLDNVLGNLKT